MGKRISYINSLFYCAALCVPASGATIYVDVDAAGANNGTSWTHAYTSLATGIRAASVGDEVWVAEGTYDAITLKSGVKVYGGFAATESSASQSNPELHPTYINKRGGDRPVTSIGNDRKTVLQGFIITGGKLTMDDHPTIGAGMYLENSDAMIVQCVFTRNTAETIAGAVANRAGSPTFVNCKFYGNDGGWSCGAFYNQASGAPAFINCLFYENVADQGGAICNMIGSMSFTNCTIADNRATHRGGAIYDYAGDATLRNCILWDNAAPKAGTEQIENAKGTTTITHSNVKGGWSGTSNLGRDADPLFVDPANDDYRLQAGSPCRNAGHSALLPADVADISSNGNRTETLPNDLALKPRVEGDSVDMGAFEWHPPGG